MCKKIVLSVLSLCASICESQNKTTSQENKATERKQNFSLPLDFTPLPYDLQRLVLGYITAGWQHVDGLTTPYQIEDLYYHDNSQLVAISGVQARAISFEKNINHYKLNRIGQAITAQLSWDIPHCSVISPGRHNIESGMNVYCSKNYRASCNFGSLDLYQVGKEGTKLWLYKIMPGDSDNKENELHTKLRVCFSWDETIFAVTRENSVYLYQLKSGKLLKSFKLDCVQAYDVALSPDLKYVATSVRKESCHADEIVVCNIDSGDQISFKNKNGRKGQDAEINALTFSPNSQNLVVGSIVWKQSQDQHTTIWKTMCGQIDVWEFQPDLNDLKQ